MGDVNLLKNIKVLYVEDEPITRQQVCKFLKEKVGKVIEAKNGEEGIEKFMKYKPDIVITDLIMPYIDGIDMVKKLRSDGFNCPIIMISSLSDADTVLKAVDLKIEKYMIKPIDVNLLLENLVQIANELLTGKDRLVFMDNAETNLEIKIKDIYSNYLKKVTGEEAKLIKVFIDGKQIEIFSKENLTTLEENLLAIGHYHKSIEILRRALYECTIDDVEKKVSELIDRKIVTKEIDIYPKENFERIVLEIM